MIVLGAGFAGLSAATALAERGARVLVLEARATLGGRATAFTDPATRERVDNGQHVLFGCYHETFRFLRRIGAESSVAMQRQLTIGVVSPEGHASRLVCPSLPAPLHLLAGVARWEALGWRDRVAALRLGLAIRPLFPRRAASAPGRNGIARGATVREWLIAQRQTPRLIELLWEPLAVAALNQPIDAAAAAPFARVLADLFGPGGSDAALGMPLKPLDELYALPAKAFIEARGGEVRTSSPATVVCGAPVSVVVRGERIAPRAVVCAVPWHALPAAIEQAPPPLAAVLDNASRTAASPIVTVNLWLDRPVTGDAFVGLPGRAMQWVFDKRMVFGEGATHLSLVSSGAGAIVARTNDELIAMALGELRAALPRAGQAELRRAVVVRERRATFSVAPGQPPRPGTRTAVPGLFLAGDWIDTGLPATIEGAVLSGHRAAADIP